MKKEELIKFCRYYKGETSVPKGTPASFWEYERKWVILSISAKEELEIMVDEYLLRGLRTFEDKDDTPATLKALLFNRYCHWIGIDIEGFKKWYSTEYYQS